MNLESTYINAINDQTNRTLWSLNNVIDSIPEEYWDKLYCDMPLWKHVYHTLHSLDMWYINPLVYEEPYFHTVGLSDLDTLTKGYLSREVMKEYYHSVREKILSYLKTLDDGTLLEYPEKSPYNRFHLIMAQHRHLDMHIGMIMGFIIAGKDLWPRVLGLQSEIPEGEYSIYF